MSTQEKQGGNILAIIVMFALFCMIAFITNFAGSMGVIVKNQFNASNAMSQLGSCANFFAYLFMGIPGGLILKRKGYKFTALTAVSVGFVGVGVQLLSGYVGSFGVYVTGAFIAGFSMCLLNLVVNPLLNTLGGEGNRGNRLVQFGSSLNSIGGTIAPVVLGYLIGGEVAKANVMDAAPALLISMGIFAFAFVVVALSRIPEPHKETAEEKAARLAGKTSVMKDIAATVKYRHFTLGAVAIFLYIVVECGIPNMANLYMTDTMEVSCDTVKVEEVKAYNEAQAKAEETAEKAAAAKGEKYVKPVAKPGEQIVTYKVVSENGAEVGKKIVAVAKKSYVGGVVAGAVVAIYWFLMMIGRILGGVFGAKVSSRAMMAFCATGGILLMLAAMFCPETTVTLAFIKDAAGHPVGIPLAMCFAVLCGLSTSVMWGAIFNLAAEGLGKYVPMGSGIFMAMVFGGALLPFQGLLADTVGILNSYWLTVALFGYMLFYALVGSRIKK